MVVIQSVYIETYGCSNNLAESQIMAGLLARAGFELVKDIEISNIIILNTCSVKETTINKILHRIQELQRKYPKKKMLIAGCMPETNYKAIKDVIPEANILSTNHLSMVVKAVLEILSGRMIEYVGQNKEAKVCLPKIRENKVIDIVPICSGCNSFCSFCSTKFAKGNVFSYPEEKIIKEIQSAKSFGTKEFWITGQDVASYGLDNNDVSLLPELLNKILDKVSGRYFLRIGMLNPKNVLPISDKLLKIYKSDNVFKFLHLPVQSGSDKILKKMNRGYTIEDFIDIIRKFRRHINDITIWTDIIVGFPGESDDDFQASINLVKEIKPDWVNISRFSPHHITQASKMKQITSEIKKERSRVLSQVVREISKERNEKWIGWSGEILIDEYNRIKQNWIGRNFAYKPVVLYEKRELGKFVKVKIIDAKSSCLIGLPIC